MMDILKGLAIDNVGEFLINTVNSKISEYKNKKQWEKLFVDTNEFLLKKVEHGDALLTEIAEYLSGEDIKAIAKKLKQSSQYDFHEKLYAELTRLMLKYEIPRNEAKYYISNFMSIIFHELEQTNPDMFQIAYIGDWRKKDEIILAEVKNELSIIYNAISKIENSNSLVYTTDQVEVRLYNGTVNPRLGLDFFEVDDEVFKEEFEDALLTESNIYIKGQCKEETVLCVLNELRAVQPDKLVLVVKSEDDWKKLLEANEKDAEIGGKILIPWFYAEQILSIPNNTNIFVFGSEEYCVGKNVIEIRKRKRDTILKKLVDYGMEYEDAYKLVEDTHGLYIPMKKRLINGTDNKDPDWLNADMSIVIPLLLCGKWTEEDGDIMAIEEMCGTPYQEAMHRIERCFGGENPLFIRFRNHGRTEIHLASTENAWVYLDDKVDFQSEVWKKYDNLVTSLLTEEDPRYNFPEEKQSYAHILPGGASCWSSTLKEGLLSSLVMKAYLNNKVQNQKVVDGIVSDVLGNVDSKKKWLSIAKLFPLLCEASPSAIVKRLDSEWVNETGLKEVFIESKDKSFFSRNEYTYYIWGIEQLLCQNEYAAWAVRWFLKMNELRRKYPISNSPYDTLGVIFCPWINVTVLKQEDKIILAEEAFSQNRTVWDLFYSELPGMRTTIMSTISKPRYRMISDDVELTNLDIKNAFDAYTNLCLNNMDFMPSRWEKIIEHINHFDSKTISKIADGLRYEIQSMDDSEKISIKEKIRHEIYRNRYFESSEWAMNEQGLNVLENLLKDIHVNNQVYEYRYLFQAKYDFPLMNPHPYSDTESHKLNDVLIDNEIREGIQKFKNSGLDVIQLAEMCSEYCNNTLGTYLFTIYSKEKFDKKIFEKLLADSKVERIMLDYVRAAYRNSRVYLQKAYNIAKQKMASDNTIVKLLMIETIDVDKNPLIVGESDEIKKTYWENFCRGLFISNNATAHFVIREMLKYSTHMSIIEVLDECKEHFTPEEILGIFEKIRLFEVGNPNSMSGYHVEELLSILQKTFMFTDECIRVAQIELSYRGLIDVEKMACLNRCLKESPDLYLQILAYIFKDDDGERVGGVDVDEKSVSSVFSLYYNLHFCPAEENGNVSLDKLNAWVATFLEGLKLNKQARLFDWELGRLFANSPMGEDGCYPSEGVRTVIEQLNSESLGNEYGTAVFNSRGIFSPSGGKEERRIAKEYKENADKIRLKWPITAKIYDDLHDRYMYEANSEREREEYAGV